MSYFDILILKNVNFKIQEVDLLKCDILFTNISGLIIFKNSHRRFSVKHFHRKQLYQSLFFIKMRTRGSFLEHLFRRTPLDDYIYIFVVRRIKKKQFNRALPLKSLTSIFILKYPKTRFSVIEKKWFVTFWVLPRK